MKNPADAERPPLGATYVMTGTGEETIRSMVCRMASIRPPGVLRRTIRTDGILGFRAIDGAADDFRGDGMHHSIHVHRNRLRGRGHRLRQKRKRHRQNGLSAQSNLI